MHIDLSGKKAIVTGSTDGIGLAIAIGLAKAGASVVLVGREQGAWMRRWHSCVKAAAAPTSSAWLPMPAPRRAARR
ncbi:hypothetical protein SSTU70S_04747 [Stutzerimonas stutzeri]